MCQLRHVAVVSVCGIEGPRALLLYPPPACQGICRHVLGAELAHGVYANQNDTGGPNVTMFMLLPPAAICLPAICLTE